jgi:L-Ala-D/L-Glu epimerase
VQLATPIRPAHAYLDPRRARFAPALHLENLAQRQHCQNVRYGETPALLQTQFEALQANGLEEVDDLAALDALLLRQPVAQALRFALEAALTHALAAQAGQPVWEYLGVPAPLGAVPTAFSLPIMEPTAVAAFLTEQNARRFNLLKVKVNATDGLALLQAVAAAAPGQPLLVDGNETWTSAAEVLAFLQAVAAAGRGCSR